MISKYVESRILKSIFLYFLLAIVQMILSFSFVIYIKAMFEAENVVGIKIAVDVLLFVISYFVQQKYIFKNNKR